MARIRSVKPEFWEDEVVGTLSRDARLLFIATWNLADDEGRLRWTPDYLKASVFMYDDDVKARRVALLMAELSGAGLVTSYTAGKAQQCLAQVVNFKRHQRINRPGVSRFPAPYVNDSMSDSLNGSVNDSVNDSLTEVEVGGGSRSREQGSTSSSARGGEPDPAPRDDDEDDDPPDGSGQPHVPPSTPAAITVAASLNGTSTRAWLHGTDDRGGLTAGEWTKSALRTLTTQAISDELPADSWPPWAGQVLGEHVAECSRREVTATKVGQLRTLCARHDALSVLEALEVALTDTAVRDHVAYARKCLSP